MIVLGIDASYSRAGFACIETDGVPGRERILNTCSLGTSTAEDDETRCAAIAERAVELATQAGADLVGIEKPFIHGKNRGNTPLRLQQLDTTVQCALRAAGFEVIMVNNSQAKRALGIGRSDSWNVKQKALDAVNRRYDLALTDDNRADAIGVALAAVRLQWRQQRSGQVALPGVKRGRRAKKIGGAS